VSDKFSQFVRERQYLQNVSPATVEWYKHSFKWLRTENPSEQELKDAVIRMREKGLKATGCNSAIRAINAYLKWIGSPHRLRYLKEEHRVLPTFSAPDIKKILAYQPNPKNRYQRRLQLLILVLLDTGCRIDEVLSLKAADCDLDNLLFTVMGKGRKQRKIPFSFELRRHLCQFLVDLHPEQLIFTTRHGKKTRQAKCTPGCEVALPSFRHYHTRTNTPCIPAHLFRLLSAQGRERALGRIVTAWREAMLFRRKEQVNERTVLAGLW
jgi:integrase/recombinase XerD